MKNVLAASLTSLIVVACGSDEPDADRFGVGAECASTEECLQDPVELSCIPTSTFRGGYCGILGCTNDAECPEASRCVTHEDTGQNYCFRVCIDKALDCNANRTPENEANCVSSKVTFVDSGDTARAGDKVCVPPSGS